MRRPLVVGLLSAAAFFALTVFLRVLAPSGTPTETAAPAVSVVTPFPTATPPVWEKDPVPSYQPGEVVDGVKVGGWTITAERKGYADGTLRLVIPTLDVDVPVLNGTDTDTLLRGVGLYEYAQLPGDGNRNVSIAGHRNGLKNGLVTDNMPFYYLDTLEEGDYLYLSDSGHLYRYLFCEATVVEPDDWSVIAATGSSCLTLTTCTPIGVADHRLVIRGNLDEILPADDTAVLPAKEEST